MILLYFDVTGRTEGFFTPVSHKYMSNVTLMGWLRENDDKNRVGVRC